MENGQNVIAIGTQDGIIVKPLELNKHSRMHSDIMIRRLKNRERQRRYRARKRLEADMKKDFVSKNATKLQGDVALNGNHHNTYISRVHCKRKWKKDARRAYACKNLKETLGATNLSALALNSESQTQSLPPQIAIEAQLERKNHVENPLRFPGSETKAKLHTRNWKAEARRKKN